MSDPKHIKTPFENSETSRLQMRRLQASVTYAVLAGFFRHPAAGGGRESLAENLSVLGALFDQAGEREAARQTEKIKTLLAHFSLADHISEYEGCFGHTAHSRTSPYELEYGEEHSHRQPQELADITAFYRAFGLQVSEMARERADHVSTECEFMHFLLLKECRAREQGRQEDAEVCERAAGTFLSDHLGRWLPAFAYKLSKTAESDFFREAVGFTTAFIHGECARLGIPAGPNDLPVRNVEEGVEAGCVSCQFGSASKTAEGTSCGSNPES